MRATAVPALALALALAGPARAQDAPAAPPPGEGKRLYDKYCAQCHGDTGRGDGPAATRLKPAPRDFTAGKFKVRTTPSGRLPTDDDLVKVIRDGLPYTSMPGWPRFSDGELRQLVDQVKSFHAGFADPERKPEPIEIPSAPDSAEESVKRGSEIYVQLGCGRCHGDLGRGDGPSAPTLQDDWGYHLWPADLSQRWTFIGGPSETDIFRTFSTGLNGTPMPSYADAIPVEDRWHLVNYIVSLGDGADPRYASLAEVEYVAEEIDLGRGAELFEQAKAARFPLVGQIMEPGRNFYPPASSIEVRAVHNLRDVAIELRWHDMRADMAGSNAPDIAVPDWDEQEHPYTAAAKPAAPAAGAPAVDDIWGGGEQAATIQPIVAGPSEFSDAVAIQLPLKAPEGIRKPYFLFGDTESPVDLWFVDLARGQRVLPFVGRGSAALLAASGSDVEVVSAYDRGQWTVTFKRPIRAASGMSFGEGQWVPVAFSVWDGYNLERGNKRAVSQWMYLYFEPSEQISAAGPMLQAALAVLFVELLIVFAVHRRHRKRERSGAAGPTREIRV